MRLKEEHYEWANKNHPTIINTRLAEIKQNMFNILNGNPDKMKSRWEKYQLESSRRIAKTLSQ